MIIYMPSGFSSKYLPDTVLVSLNKFSHLTLTTALQDAHHIPTHK